MDKNLNLLIQALREELQQYGEMLVRLDQHRQFVGRQAGGDLNESAGGIQSQGAAIQRARHHREQARRTVAGMLGLEAETPIEKIIPRLPADYQPLANALVQENQELLAQVLQVLRRNQFLLARSLSRMEHFLNSVFPGDFDKMDSAPVQKPVHISVVDRAPREFFEVEVGAKTF